MSRVLAEVAGKLATWLGYDGTDFRNVHVDADGDLQVDVLTTAMSALAATAANQATMITALELIDDLRNALHTVGTDELRVLVGVFGATWKGLHVDAAGDLQADVLSSALPTGASTSANQTTMITALQLIDDLRNALVTVGTDELRVSVLSSALPALAATSTHQLTQIAKFQDQAFTYKRQIYERVTHNKVGAGHYTMTGAACPADTVWVINGIMAYDWQTALGALYLGLDKAGVQYWQAGTGAIAAKAAYNTYTPMILVEGDKVAAYFYGCSDGDALAMMYNGYAMTLAP